MNPEQPPNTQFANTHQPPSCQHVKLNGDACGQPARRGRRFCRFHDETTRKRPEFSLPVIEDAASLQLALNQIMRGLADDLLNYKKASLLLYGCQIASANLKRLRDEAQISAGRTGMAREKSLMELLLDQFQVPHDEDEQERVLAELNGHRPQPGHLVNESALDHEPPVAGFPFDIKACAEPANIIPTIPIPTTPLPNVPRSTGQPAMCSDSGTDGRFSHEGERWMTS